MQREYGLLISNRAFKKLLQSILHVAEEKLFCQMKGKCMVSTNDQYHFEVILYQKLKHIIV